MPVFLLYAGIIHAIALALLLPMIVTLPGPGAETAPARPPASAPAGEIAPVDVVVLPPPQPLTDVGPEETSALPAGPRPREGNAPAAAPGAIEPEPRQETREDGPAPEPQEQATPPQPAPAKTETVEPETPATGGVEAAPVPNEAAAPPALKPHAGEAPQQPELPSAKPSAAGADKPEKKGAEAQTPVPLTTEAEAKNPTPARLAPRTTKKTSAQRSRTAKPALSRTAKSQAKFAPFNGMLSGLLSPPAAKRK